MRKSKPSEHFRSLERLCLEQAKFCLPQLGREALEELAKNYRQEAQRLECGEK